MIFQRDIRAATAGRPPRPQVLHADVGGATSCSPRLRGFVPHDFGFQTIRIAEEDAQAAPKSVMVPSEAPQSQREIIAQMASDANGDTTRLRQSVNPSPAVARPENRLGMEEQGAPRRPGRCLLL